jgi:hypothetical protein
VVALCDQWYLDYGEPSWRAECEKALKKLEVYDEAARKQFEIALDWLREHAVGCYGVFFIIFDDGSVSGVSRPLPPSLALTRFVMFLFFKVLAYLWTWYPHAVG